MSTTSIVFVTVVCIIIWNVAGIYLDRKGGLYAPFAVFWKVTAIQVVVAYTALSLIILAIIK